MNRFNIAVLRFRAKVHDLHDSGMGVEGIAERLNTDVALVERSLKLVKPILIDPLFGNWQNDAACSGADLNDFFPEVSGLGAKKKKERAKRVCAGCPVSADCFEFARSRYENYGVWGGVDFGQFKYSFDEATGNVAVQAKGNNGAVAEVG